MGTDLRGVGRQLKMSKISKCDKKLKMLSFLNESVISFAIFSEHKWLP